MPLVLVGRYLPQEKVGWGAFGTTFLATDLHSATERKCIVKQLQPKHNLNSEQLEGVKEKFRREAKILETLGAEHRQIPSLYAYFELSVPAFRESHPLADPVDEFFYLVQEYIDGQTLAEELKEKGRASETEAIGIMRQLLPVLQFMHEHDDGAIHRDIKPGNIMRDRKGRLYLIDFGAVKQVTAGVPTQSSLVLATPLFAPPEQQAGKQIYPSSDLYSVAVTILCFLTEQDLETMFDPHTNRWNWRPYADVSDRLANILDKMLEPVPSQRFQSADGVLTALDQEEVSVQKSSSKPEADVTLPAATLVSPDPDITESSRRDMDADIFSHTELSHVTDTDSEEKSTFPEFLRQATVLGIGGWLIATALVSFLGTLLASGFWLLILGGLIFGVLAHRQPFLEKIRLLMIAIVSVGVTFFLVPHLFGVFSFVQALPQVLGLAVLAGLFAFVLIILSQLIHELL